MSCHLRFKRTGKWLWRVGQAGTLGLTQSRAAWLVLVFAWSAILAPAEPAPLTTLQQVHNLTNAAANQNLPVAFEATVTYYRGYEGTLFVQDGKTGVYVWAPDAQHLEPGDRVLVRGVTGGSYRPIVWKSKLTVLRHGALPAPTPATYPQLIRGESDSRLVAVRGVVRWASPSRSLGRWAAQLNLLVDGGDVWVNVNTDDPQRVRELFNSEVEVTGVAGGLFDSKMQLTGIILHSNSLSQIKVLHKAKNDPWSLPPTPLDEVLRGRNVQDLSSRVRVVGILTYFYPASQAILQDGTRSIRIETRSAEPLRIGDRVEALGIPSVEDGFLTLRFGELRSLGNTAPLTPAAARWDDLAHGRLAFNLATIEGKVVSQVREQGYDVYIISADGHLFSAALRFPYVENGWTAPKPPPTPAIPAGSIVRVTGVVAHENGSPFAGPMAFAMMLRSASDLQVLARPSWINVRNLAALTGLLLCAIVAGAFWNYILKRKVAKQAAELAVHLGAKTEAAVERQRSRILEDINNGKPLDGILRQVVELLSSNLGNAACWCKVLGGERIGTVPPGLQNLNVIRQEILSRVGSSYGQVFAGLASDSPHIGNAAVTLSIGARLIALAIDTQSTYSELRHRSEFDQLTETYNRFSFEKRLDDLVAQAGAQTNRFGLIYMDLDRFKEVNDKYGHQVGDLYLQRVCKRISNQLRSGDLLARLGGDEFAVLAQTSDGRAEIEEVARRLERCFDEPFSVSGYSLRGAASIGIAMFPEDGESSSRLLQAADSAMYLTKNHTAQSGALMQ